MSNQTLQIWWGKEDIALREQFEDFCTTIRRTGLKVPDSRIGAFLIFAALDSLDNDKLIKGIKKTIERG